VTYGRERARPLLHRRGFRLRRVRHRPLKAPPEAQAAFVQALATPLADWPPQRELLFVDEATGRRHPTLTAQWCLVDEVPEVPTGDDHTKIHLYGAVAPRTGRTHYHIGQALGQAEFATFLRQLLRDYEEQEWVVIHDRAEQHKGPPVAAVVQAAKGRLRLQPQPAYSPELNPEERIWKWMRRVVTHTHWFETLQEETQAIRNFFCYLASRKAQVQQLCQCTIPASFVGLL
jgi:transposase